MEYKGKAFCEIVTNWLNSNAQQRNEIETDFACLFDSMGIRFAMFTVVGFQQCFFGDYVPSRTEMKNVIIQVNNGDVYMVVA